MICVVIMKIYIAAMADDPRVVSGEIEKFIRDEGHEPVFRQNQPEDSDYHCFGGVALRDLETCCMVIAFPAEHFTDIQFDIMWAVAHLGRFKLQSVAVFGDMKLVHRMARLGSRMTYIQNYAYLAVEIKRVECMLAKWCLDNPEMAKYAQ